MCQVNVLDAKITPMNTTDVSKRLGIAKGKLIYPDDINDGDEEIAKMFGL